MTDSKGRTPPRLSVPCGKREIQTARPQRFSIPILSPLRSALPHEEQSTGQTVAQAEKERELFAGLAQVKQFPIDLSDEPVDASRRK